MGDLRPDNGPPEDGGANRDGLPDLPGEWGTIIIPDDPAELAAEARAVRRELRREARRRRVTRLLGLDPGRSAAGEPPAGLGVPFLIMALAIVVTVVSLFVITWDPGSTRPAPTSTVPAPASWPQSPRGPTASSRTALSALSELNLVDPTGRRVRLASLLPAVILLVDGCACADLVREIAAVVPAGVRVIVVGREAPDLATPATRARALADPAGALRAGPATGSAGVVALLVDASGKAVSGRADAASVYRLGQAIMSW